MIYIIIGAGGFGLYTALNLRKLDKNSIIKIIDKDKNNSATVQGGNGITDIKPIPQNLFNFISFSKYKTPIYISKINNIYWYLIYIINNLFNNNKKKIFELTGESNEYHEYNYWDNIYKLCEENNIEIIQDNIIDYDNQYVYSKSTNYKYNKLILATGADLSLIKNESYKKYINIFSGVAVIVKVKTIPNKFYFANDIFITPYKDSIKITCLLQFGNNLEINKEKIYNYIKHNKEVNKLGFIDIINYWEGSRPMTYDTIPFYTNINNNIYWICGGSYLGTHTCELFGEKLAEYIITNKTDNYFTLHRLIKIKQTYLIYFIIFIIICVYFLLKKIDRA